MAHRLPLSGVLVLDLGQIYNGSYATFLMAMAGATVVKIEPPGGESLRGRSSVGGIAYPFAMLNSNKQSVVLNLKTPAGITTFKRLAEVADVVLENFAPGTMDKLGIGYEQLSEINPRLVYAAGSGFGRSGPFKRYPAMDLTVQAFSGMMSVTGYPDGPPTKCGPAVCDFAGGTHLYAATVTALFDRERTGRGQLIEVSMQEAVYMTLSSNFAMLHATGETSRTGNRHGGNATSPYNVYPTSDGHVAITCTNDKHWSNLTILIGAPHLGDDPRYRTMGDRVSRLDEVDAIVAGWTSARTKEDAFQALVGVGIPAAPVRTVVEVANDRHMHERGMLQWVDHPSLGRVVLPTSPLRFGDAPLPELRIAPELGVDTVPFLRASLDLGDQEIERLKEAGALGPAAVETGSGRT